MTFESRSTPSITSYQDSFLKEFQKRGAHPHLFVVTDFPFLHEAILFTFTDEVKKAQCSISSPQSLGGFLAHSRNGQVELFQSRSASVIRDTGPISKDDEKDEGSTSSKKSKKEGKGEELKRFVLRVKESEKSNPLIFLSSSDAILPIIKTEYPSALVYSFCGQKPWDKASEAIAWIEWFISKNGYTAEKQAVQALYDSLEGDFHAVKNELLKCMSYTYGSKKITSSDIQEVCLVKEKANLMKLFDEMLSNSMKGVVREMYYIEEDDSTHPIAILRFIKQQATLFIDVLTGRKPLPYKSKTYENRLRLAEKIGCFRLEEWIWACTQYEIALRDGQEVDALPSRMVAFLLQLIR